MWREKKAFEIGEEQVLEELTKEDNVLVSTGGGSVLRERNRENLKTKGIGYLSKRRINVIVVKRTKDDTKRPLLKRAKCKKVIEKILRERVRYTKK